MNLFRRPEIGRGVRVAPEKGERGARVAQAVERIRVPSPAQPQPSGSRSLPTQYRRGRSAAALVALLALFLAAWSLNGHTTALGVNTTFGWSYAQGWAVHLVMTLIELSLPQIRPLLRGVPFYWSVVIALFLVVLAVGVFDVWSFTHWVYASTSAPVTTASAVVATLIGEAAAIVPEPVIIALVVALWRLKQVANT